MIAIISQYITSIHLNQFFANYIRYLEWHLQLKTTVIKRIPYLIYQCLFFLYHCLNLLSSKKKKKKIKHCHRFLVLNLLLILLIFSSLYHYCYFHLINLLQIIISVKRLIKIIRSKFMRVICWLPIIQDLTSRTLRIYYFYYIAK